MKTDHFVSSHSVCVKQGREVVSGKVCGKEFFCCCPPKIKYDLGGSVSLQKSAVLHMEYILLGKFLQQLQADVFEMSGVGQYFC